MENFINYSHRNDPVNFEDFARQYKLLNDSSGYFIYYSAQFKSHKEKQHPVGMPCERIHYGYIRNILRLL